MILHRHELAEAVGLGRFLQLDELPREHRRRAEVQRLAGLHDIVPRDSVWMSVDYQLIDVIEAQPIQAGIYCFEDVLAR